MIPDDAGSDVYGTPPPDSERLGTVADETLNSILNSVTFADAFVAAVRDVLPGVSEEDVENIRARALELLDEQEKLRER